MSDKKIEIHVYTGMVVVKLPDGQVARIPREETAHLAIGAENLLVNHPEAETPDKPWMPLELAAHREVDGQSVASKPNEELWKNDIYTVTVSRFRYPLDEEAPDMVHLSIRRNDRHWARDWRHFQLIKNQLVGPECEGMELYPAESRLMDMANQYHMWVLAEPGTRIPVGYEDGRVVASKDPMVSSARQRPLPEGTEETVGADEAKKMVHDYLSQHDPALLETLQDKGFVP